MYDIEKWDFSRIFCMQLMFYDEHKVITMCDQKYSRDHAFRMQSPRQTSVTRRKYLAQCRIVFKISYNVRAAFY